MGYRIEYDGSTAQKTIIRISKGKKRLMLTILAAVLTLGAVAFPRSRGILRDLLLPGDEEVTTAALEGLVEDLKEGEPFGDAVETFCREIIYGY